VEPAPDPSNEEDLSLLHILVDADACPVKQEVYKAFTEDSIGQDTAP